jgi:uncharacterized protein (UPF0332 family)
MKVNLSVGDPSAYLDEANEKLEASKSLMDNGFFDDSVSRSYYAIYNAAKAALVSKDLDAKTHSGLISLFSKEFVKTGEIKVEVGKAMSHVQEGREKADYEPLIDADREEAEEMLEKAEAFVSAVEDLF